MKEVDLYTNVALKLEKKYPAFFKNLIEEFCGEFEIESQEELKLYMKQIFYGWLFVDYVMLDGKRITDFCFSALDLTKDEYAMLENIKFCIKGIFEIKDNDGKILKLADVVTKEKYVVSIIDFEHKKGLMKANLVRNFKGELFLFGGATPVDKAEIEEMLKEEGLH